MTDYTPERAEPETVPVAPNEPEKKPFWDSRNRHRAYWAALTGLIVAGIQFGYISIESTSAWMDVLSANGTGMAAWVGAIVALIGALRNPTPDGSM